MAEEILEDGLQNEASLKARHRFHMDENVAPSETREKW